MFNWLPNTFNFGMQETTESSGVETQQLATNIQAVWSRTSLALAKPPWKTYCLRSFYEFKSDLIREFFKDALLGAECLLLICNGH